MQKMKTEAEDDTPGRVISRLCKERVAPISGVACVESGRDFELNTTSVPPVPFWDFVLTRQALKMCGKGISKKKKHVLI